MPRIARVEDADARGQLADLFNSARTGSCGTRCLRRLPMSTRSTKRQAARRYSTTVLTAAGPRKCLQVVIPREGKKLLIARFGGLSQRRRKSAVLKEPTSVGAQKWVNTTELV
jgi:hypothetical protein